MAGRAAALFAPSGATGLQGGGNSLFTTVPLARWFVRNRGKALSMAFIGTPAGIFVFPTLTQLLIDEFGWRSAWAIIGIFGGIVVVIVALTKSCATGPPTWVSTRTVLTTRRRSPARRVLPTLPSTAGRGSRPCARARFGVSPRSTALRPGTLGFFRVAYFIDQGVDEHVVALALSSVALSALPASLVSGWVVDRFQPRYVSFAATVVMC